MDPGERRWLFGGAALLLAAGSFTAVRVLDSDSAPAAQSAARPVAERPIAAERFGGNLPGSPTLARVARDGRVWVLLRRRGHTSLARLEGRLLREVPLGEEPTDLVEGYARAPYLSYSASGSVGVLGPEGHVLARTPVPGVAHDVAVDRAGNLWFTNRARSALGIWDQHRLDEDRLTRNPRPLLDDIVLGGSGGSKLWFLDDRGRVGLVEPMGRTMRLFDVPGRPSPGPSRLTATIARKAWYTTQLGVGRVDEEGRATLVVRRLPVRPGAIVGGSDGNLWVAARRGPRLFRISPSGEVSGFRLDVPENALLRDIARDTRHAALWIAAASPRALLRVALPQLRSKLR